MLKRISDLCYECRVDNDTFLLKSHVWGSYNLGTAWDLIVIVGNGDGHRIATFATKDDGTRKMHEKLEGGKLWGIDEMVESANDMIRNFEDIN